MIELFRSEFTTDIKPSSCWVRIPNLSAKILEATKASESVQAPKDCSFADEKELHKKERVVPAATKSVAAAIANVLERKIRTWSLRSRLTKDPKYLDLLKLEFMRRLSQIQSQIDPIEP